MRNILIGGLLSIVLGLAPAGAAWNKASTPHFVIYADDSPDRLRTFATKLEKFDKAVRQVRGMADPRVGDGNRLTVFVVPDVQAVRKLATSMTGLTPNLSGFLFGARGRLAGRGAEEVG